MGIPQLFGSSLMVRSLLARNQFLTDIAVSQISSKHPKATTPPEISERVNHFALSASSDNLTGSGAPEIDSLMNERAKEMRCFLIYLACCGGIAICELVYILILAIRPVDSKRHHYPIFLWPVKGGQGPIEYS
jgi:hypothetical protein